MKTQYKYIHFVKVDDAWECYNTKYDTFLGDIAFYELWKQYVFWPANGDIIFSASCLADIQHFIGQL